TRAWRFRPAASSAGCTPDNGAAEAQVDAAFSSQITTPLHHGVARAVRQLRLLVTWRVIPGVIMTAAASHRMAAFAKPPSRRFRHERLVGSVREHSPGIGSLIELIDVSNRTRQRELVGAVEMHPMLSPFDSMLAAPPADFPENLCVVVIPLLDHDSPHRRS